MLPALRQSDPEKRKTADWTEEALFPDACWGEVRVFPNAACLC
jgi:hypothetical protein